VFAYPKGVEPEVVAKLLAKRAGQLPGARLTDREREVLALMAGGRSNSAIAQRLFVSEKAVTKHSTSIFAKLGLPPSEDDNRRVLAVLAYLNALPGLADHASFPGRTGPATADRDRPPSSTRVTWPPPDRSPSTRTVWVTRSPHTLIHIEMHTIDRGRP
jgi:DNA-binding CsgD family transcriptional regulator